MANYVISVFFHLKPETRDPFLQMVRDNAAKSLRTEQGCRRFDVCVLRDDPTKVFLYELYDDEAAFDAHLQTAHFKAFAEGTKGMAEKVDIGKLELLPSL